MSMILKPLRLLAKALAALDDPRSLALGLAFGLAAGLIPKSSLLAPLALVFIGGLKVNLAAAYAAAALASILGPALDPAAHFIGFLLLSKAELLRPLWTSLYNAPVLPWTGFNNTVTLGWLVLGLGLIAPVYKISLPACERWGPPLGERIRRLKLVQLLLGADLGSRFG